MTSSSRAWLQIHFCVVLWGFTAILGKLVTLSAPALVWWRMLIVSAALLCLPQVLRSVISLPMKLLASYAGIGVIVALHWLAFYGSIKLSNASVAATCMATCTVFMALAEPVFTHRRFNLRELLLGIAMIPAVALVVDGTPTAMHLGIAIGIVSAALVAIFGSMNKRLVDKANPLAVTFVEMAAGFLFLTVALPFIPHESTAFVLPDFHDGALLVILALACTLLPFALSLVALRHLTAFGTQLVVNLEPVYAILLAIPLLGEQHELSAKFYSGVIAIVAIVFAYPFIGRTAHAVKGE